MTTAGAMAFLPVPFKDETLHSLLARQMRMVCGSIHLGFIEGAFGAGAACVRPLMPGRVGVFARAAGATTTAEVDRAVDRWTALAYFAPFMTTAAEAALRTGLREGHARGGYSGLPAVRGVPWHERLTFCPECLEADTAAQGIAAWRRCHQLPGNYLCPTHGAGLLASNVSAAASSRLVVCPGEGPFRELQSPFGVATALRIARDTAWLLANPQQSLSAAAVQATMGQVLRAKGMLTPSGTGVGGLAEIILVAAYGRAAIPPSLLGKGSVQRLWGRTDRLGVATLGVLLALDHLDVPIAEFFQRCRPAHRASPRRSQPRVKASTILRHRWTVAAAAMAQDSPGRVAIRHAVPSPYKFLLQHDRRWLEENLPSPRRRASGISWNRRDGELAQSAQAACERLRSAAGRPRRLTFSAIVTEIGARTSLYRRDLRLPRTLAAIDAAVEDLADIVRRRLAWMVSQDRGEGSRTWSAFVVEAGVKDGLADPLLAELVRAAYRTMHPLPGEWVGQPSRP